MFTIKKKEERRSDSHGTIYVDGVCSVRALGKCRGSFSVEAAYIMPLVLLCLFLPIWIGIEQHEEVKTWVEKQQQEEIVDVISAMYQKEFITDLVGDKYED